MSSSFLALSLICAFSFQGACASSQDARVAAVGYTSSEDLEGFAAQRPSYKSEITYEHKGQGVIVEFERGGELHMFHLTEFSIYAEDADVAFHGATEKSLLDLRSSTYHSREVGKWATASIFEDGSLAGLFEIGADIVDVQPDKDQPPHPASSLLSKEVGQRVKYRANIYSMPESFWGKDGQELLQRSVSGHNISEVNSEPELVADPPKDRASNSASSEPIRAMNAGNIDPLLDRAKWNCPKCKPWFPGCYPGDHRLHVMTIGIQIDVAAVKEFGLEGSRKRAEYYVASTSFVYELQLNIRVKIGSMNIYGDATTAPDFAKQCENPKPGGNCMAVMSNKLKLMKPVKKDKEAYFHLFTGCCSGGGYAFVGQLCDWSWKDGGNHLNVGISGFSGKNRWYGFAHEMDHNFGGGHCPGGKDDKGSLMCGPAKSPTAPHFHPGNKEKICATLKKIVNPRCAKYFQVAEATSRRRRRRSRRRKSTRRRRRRRSS